MGNLSISNNANITDEHNQLTNVQLVDINTTAVISGVFASSADITATARSAHLNITLSESQRVRAIAISNTPGGAKSIVWSFTTNPVTIAKNEGAVVTQAGYMTWTMVINSAGITQAQNVPVTQTSNSGTGTLTTSLQNEYTLTIDPTSFTAAAQGATVTQPSGRTGTLKTSLSGAQTQVVVLCDSDVVFDDTGALTIDDNGTPVVVAQTAIGSVVHSGATTTVTITSAIGQVFDAAAPLVLNSGAGAVTIAANDVTGATSITTPPAVGTLSATLSGTVVAVVVESDVGVVFHKYFDLIV